MAQAKNHIQQEMDEHREELIEEIEVFTDQLSTIATVSLIVVGGAIIGYSIVKRVINSKAEPNQVHTALPKAPKKTLRQAFKGAVATFVVGLAKRKLIDYLERQKHTSSTPTTKSTTKP